MTAGAGAQEKAEGRGNRVRARMTAGERTREKEEGKKESKRDRGERRREKGRGKGWNCLEARGFKGTFGTGSPTLLRK